MFNSITTTRSIQCSPHNVTWFQLSLASQTHFRKRGKGLVNCVYKPCRTALYSAVQSRCSNSSHDTLHHCLSSNSSLENSERELGYLSHYCRNCENTSRLVFRERSYSATGTRFKSALLKIWLCHPTKLHSGGTRLAYTVHQTLPSVSLAEVGLACETSFNS